MGTQFIAKKKQKIDTEVERSAENEVEVFVVVHNTQDWSKGIPGLVWNLVAETSCFGDCPQQHLKKEIRK